MFSKRTFLKSIIAGLLLAAVPAMADGYVAPPEGYVSLHYHRADGKYDGWGVHAWKRAPHASDQPLDGVSWSSPLAPTGTDDFGPYWHMKIADFGSTGLAHYIIHKGDSKEQKGKDMQFDTKEIKEAWVTSNDEQIYKTKEEALAATK
ncbi:MAG: hypothetical protein JO218_11945 [Burkholderiales bacterium]|nr:hypothetical protein [Burkholderiales bacterium]